VLHQQGTVGHVLSRLMTAQKRDKLANTSIDFQFGQQTNVTDPKSPRGEWRIFLKNQINSVKGDTCHDACQTANRLTIFPFSSPHPRRNQLGGDGWDALLGALERITALRSLNRCHGYAAIRSGGLTGIYLGGLELGVWAVRFLLRSSLTLTTLDIRCW
jgi:hypothetical protein